MNRRFIAVALLALAPLALAAADPRGDAVACLETHGAGDPPDLVQARGWLAEEGSTAVWRLTFSQPLQVPDPVDPPFRVDILVRDPHVPTVSFGNYRRLNRIVRFDASGRNALVELLFVPEGGHTPFNAPVVDGNTLTIEMPGRLLLGTDLFGRVDLKRLRWSVVVRDGGRCDVLGSGIPSLRMATVPPPSTSSPTASIVPSATPTPSASNVAVVAAAAIAVAALALLSLVALRRRR
ncbi:MAG: hypothetical protein M3P43_02800 [Actinomycetota bacterium]|nr:hypothetical protein [Actinomycetota bacterium]